MSLLSLDTLDDRREIWRLLHRLPPLERVRFLRRACERVKAANAGHGPSPTNFTTLIIEARRCDRADERLTNAVYLDVLHLSANWKLSLRGAAELLVGLARGR